MHRDLARLLIVLAVVRVLSLSCLPSAAPPVDESPRRLELDRPLRHFITHRRSAAPRPSAPRLAGRPPRHGVAESGLSHPTPPRAVRGRLSAQPAGDLTAADTDGARGNVTHPAQRSAGRRTAVVTPPTPDSAGPRPAGLPSAVGGGGAVGQRRRGGGRRPQRRGARGRRSRRGSDHTSANPGLRIGSLNIQSLRPKLLELSEVLHRHRYDIMLLSETWLKPTVPNRLLILPGYSIHRTDRPDGRGYGGVAIVAREGLSVTPLKTNTGCPLDSRLESIWSLLKMDRGRQLLLCSLYRPPRYTAAALDADFKDLENQVQKVIMDHPAVTLFMCGDLNCDLLKSAPAPARNRLEEFLSDYSMHQLVTAPTFSSGSLLDICVVSSRSLVSDCRASFCDFSPHHIIYSRVDVPRTRRKPIVTQSRCLRRLDQDAFLIDLFSADWGSVFIRPTVSEKWDAFLSTFMPTLDKHVPMRSVRVRNPAAPPISPATGDLMARRRAALSAEGRNSAEYRDLNRAVRSAIRRDTRESIEDRIRERGPSSTWQSIRTVVGGKRPGTPVLPQLSSDELNHFFVSVGPRVAAEVADRGRGVTQPACRLPRVGACGFKVSPIDIDTLTCTVFSMRNSPARGADGVCVRVLKAGFPAVGCIILHIVNTCLIQSDYPTSWKHSLIHPIHKTGDPSDPSNFRPISIIPIISKIVERVVQRQLYHYLSSNHLLSPNQHGFRPYHSTETALVTVSDHILTATDSGEISLLCLLDLSKCFDVIDHDMLLRKLRWYGIETEWFAAYLRGHTQSVSLRDRTGAERVSLPLPNTMGVFQGSALGPLLFSVFANDLSLYAADAKVLQYADDTQLLVSGKKSELPELISRMENSLASLNQWFSANALKVNGDKTQLIAFGSRQNLQNLPDFEVTFRDTKLTPCKEVKNLGLTFDRNMTWDSHVDIVSRRCNGTLIGLSHVRHVIPRGIITTLVTALVLSQVRYCISVYGNGSKKNTARVQKILNFAAKVIFGRGKFDHVTDLRERLGWLEARKLADYNTICLAHKVLRSGEPESLSTALRYNAELRRRTTRQDGLLNVPRSRTEAGKRRFCSRAPALHNELPLDLVSLNGRRFQRALKRGMLDCTLT